MFAGQVVFITGASSGIGAALAREFAREGADPPVVSVGLLWAELGGPFQEGSHGSSPLSHRIAAR